MIQHCSIPFFFFVQEIYAIDTVSSEKVIEKGLESFSSIHLKVNMNVFC